MLSALLRGALAGAAGTTALNAVTYLDIAVRARPASETPQRAVKAVAGASTSSLGQPTKWIIEDPARAQRLPCPDRRGRARKLGPDAF